MIANIMYMTLEQSAEEKRPKIGKSRRNRKQRKRRQERVNKWKKALRHVRFVDSASGNARRSPLREAARNGQCDHANTIKDRPEVAKDAKGGVVDAIDFQKAFSSVLDQFEVIHIGMEEA
ncbi:unnamed protein product [Caenorhabditis bovis]|uniref:Uncharacterized protein n=1 Tax=Caenorhabditis bovis TaxID=2654633 RepID=A0A8S1EPQ8_9PELO|nr:unnamed protein product [Caenorhabditis bovis]